MEQRVIMPSAFLAPKPSPALVLARSLGASMANRQSLPKLGTMTPAHLKTLVPLRQIRSIEDARLVFMAAAEEAAKQDKRYQSGLRLAQAAERNPALAQDRFHNAIRLGAEEVWQKRRADYYDGSKSGNERPAHTLIYSEPAL